MHLPSGKMRIILIVNADPINNGIIQRGSDNASFADTTFGHSQHSREPTTDKLTRDGDPTDVIGAPCTQNPTFREQMGFNPVVAREGIVDMLRVNMLAAQTVIQLDHCRDRQLGFEGRQERRFMVEIWEERATG